MEKKRPFVILLLVASSFAIIALLNGNITGYSVYHKMSSIFSGNTLSTITPSLIILTIIFTVSIVALKNISK